MVLGGAVVFVYRRTRAANDTTPSFAVTLVLLTILIAVVTQVIGDKSGPARSAWWERCRSSGSGPSCVTRRTPRLPDGSLPSPSAWPWAPGTPGSRSARFSSSALAAYVMRDAGSGLTSPGGGQRWLYLQVRLGIGGDPQTLLAPTLDTFVPRRRLQSIGDRRQGTVDRDRVRRGITA